MEQGESVSAIHIRYLNPLPDDLADIFSGFHHVVVVELNDVGVNNCGQLGSLLRIKYADPKIQSITKTDGITWRISEVVDRVHEFEKANA